MDIDGYLRHGTRKDDDELHVFISRDVEKFLKSEQKGANRKHVMKIHATLGSIRRFGFQGLEDATLFKSEGRYKSGQPGMADIAVYALKAWQIRVYGGIITRTGCSVFMLPEATIKKVNKADMDQLSRVAKKLGEYNGR